MKKIIIIITFLIFKNIVAQSNQNIEKFNSSIGYENSKSLSQITEKLDTLLLNKFPSLSMEEAYNYLILISAKGDAHNFYPNNFFDEIEQIKSQGLKRMLRIPPSQIEEIDSTLNLNYQFYNKDKIIYLKSSVLDKHFLKFSNYRDRFETAKSQTLINIDSEFFESLKNNASDNKLVQNYLDTLNEVTEASGRNISYTLMAKWLLNNSIYSENSGFDINNYYVKRIVVIELLGL
jgi:hypothetical protein